ncbi:MAG: radical SAM protein [Clostridium sp.]|nr:radical SAM protein [Clostridium sp.]
MDRYSVIKYKNPREIVLLRGRGCVYKKCRFCDYHMDKCSDENENFKLNQAVLSNVTGEYGDLEVINSGSVFELDKNTIQLIKSVCLEKNIKTIHFESHYLFDKHIPKLRQEFKDFDIKMKLGLETFDYTLREQVLNKGIPQKNPEIIAKNFDEANFLFGISGQDAASMHRDIELGLTYFERICINIMCCNTTDVVPDQAVIDAFKKDVYPKYKDNDRVDILINNTDFGVGD